MRIKPDDLLLLTPLAPYICSQKPRFDTTKGIGQPRGNNPKDSSTTYFWKKSKDFFCEQVIIRGLLGKTLTKQQWLIEFKQITIDSPGYGTRGGDSSHITASMNFNAMVVEGLLQVI